jgi:hypothetical protein
LALYDSLQELEIFIFSCCWSKESCSLSLAG